MGRKITFIVLIATINFGVLPGTIVDHAYTENKSAVKIFALGGSSFSHPNLILREDNRTTEEENNRLANVERGESDEENNHFLSFASEYHPEDLSETTHDARGPPILV